MTRFLGKHPMDTRRSEIDIWKSCMGGRRNLLAVMLITIFCYLGYQSGNISHREEYEPVRVEYIKRQDIALDDVFISVKTSKDNQDTRLPIILMTWYQLAKNQTWFFTDRYSRTLGNLTNNHMVNTKCAEAELYRRKKLCCKTSVEYDHFFKSEKKWFCHFDDDNYVNIPRLLEILRRYDFNQDWYLGRSGSNREVNINTKISEINFFNWFPKLLIHSFWYATFGAGVCITRSLALKMSPVVSYGNFVKICEEMRMEDDVTMGFVIEFVLNKRLTKVPEFHSHLEQLNLIPLSTFHEQISFSYRDKNVVNVTGIDEEMDPTRFLSLHCFLFPDAEICSMINMHRNQLPQNEYRLTTASVSDRKQK